MDCDRCLADGLLKEEAFHACVLKEVNTAKTEDFGICGLYKVGLRYRHET